MLKVLYQNWPLATLAPQKNSSWKYFATREAYTYWPPDDSEENIVAFGKLGSLLEKTI